MLIKKIIFVLSFIVLGELSFAQQGPSKKDLKVSKPVKKEAKELESDGWSNIPGGLPLQNQLASAWEKQAQRDDNGFPKWIWAAGNGVGTSQTGAKLQAMEVAKIELAGQLETAINALVEASLANQQLSPEEGESITKVVAGSKNIISKTLGRVLVECEFIRNTNKGQNTEVQVRLFYNKKLAEEQAKKVIRKKLEEETTVIHEKLDKMLEISN
ncbi:MAG: hypothetical protein QM536_06625 [Chitinophagaceae bacterium]|nr:hypothetical protein [Chitinophagaceae bacterium]